MTPRQRLLLGVLSGVQFVLIVGSTIVMVSLPQIREDLGMTPAGLQWVVTVYVLTFGGFLLAGGRVVDLLGGRTVLLTGMVVFGAASVGCAAAASGEVLILFRALQGVGAAMASPAALSLLAGQFSEPRPRRMALGIWAGAGAIGGTLGNVIGGLITTVFNWHWIFLFSAPAIVLLLVGVLWVVPRSPRTARVHSGVLSAVAVTTAMGLFLLALSQAPQSLPRISVVTITGFVGALLMAGVFLLVERRSPAPLLPWSTLMQGHAGIGYLFIVLASTGMGVYYLCSIFMQDVLSYSALTAGLLFLPWTATIALGAQLGPRLLDRLPLRPTLLLALVGLSLGLGLLAWAMTPEMTKASFVAPFVLIGLGQGMMGVIATSLALSSSNSGGHGLAASVVNTSQQVGGAFFISVSGAVTILVASMARRSGTLGGAAELAGVRASLVLCLVICALGLLVAWFGLGGRGLTRPAGGGPRPATPPPDMGGTTLRP